MVVIRPLSTALIKPNVHVSISHWRGTTVSVETRNVFKITWYMWHPRINYRRNFSTARSALLYNAFSVMPYCTCAIGLCFSIFLVFSLCTPGLKWYYLEKLWAIKVWACLQKQLVRGINNCNCLSFAALYSKWALPNMQTAAHLRLSSPLWEISWWCFLVQQPLELYSL